MDLVVFDLDGTLARTSDVDGRCFVQALADTFGLEAADTDWAAFDHVTDRGILNALFRVRFGGSPSAEAEARVVGRLVDLLEARHRAEPRSFTEVPGARALLASLADHASFRAALATGGWERAARFKCRVAGLDVAGLPCAFGEDGPARETIVAAAVARARQAYRALAFDRVVSVGDAVWDVHTARALDLPFVGIADAANEEGLRKLGVSHIVADYLDVAAFLRALENATPPGS